MGFIMFVIMLAAVMCTIVFIVAVLEYDKHWTHSNKQLKRIADALEQVNDGGRVTKENMTQDK